MDLFYLHKNKQMTKGHRRVYGDIPIQKGENLKVDEKKNN
jgi:hypothetical protein